MSKFTPKPKSPLELQAQIVSFVNQSIPNFNDASSVMKNAGSLAKSGLRDLKRTLPKDEYRRECRSETNRLGKLPAGTVLPVANADDYKEYLRDVGGRNHAEIAERVIILKAYEEFKPVVETLKNEIRLLGDDAIHPQFLGKGSNAWVYKVTHQGEVYAVRIPNNEQENTIAVEHYLSGACLSIDLPNMEQIVAASYQDGVTVAKLMPGKEMGRLTIADVQAITASQLKTLLETVVEANRRGIEIDPKPSNFFYDQETGFGIIDYTSAKKIYNNSAKQEQSTVVGWLASVICNATFYGKSSKEEMTPADYQNQAERLSANRLVLIQLRDIIQAEMGTEPAMAKIRKEFDQIIAGSETNIKKYSDPKWVAKQIAERAAYLAERNKARSETSGAWSDLDLIV